MIAFILHTLMCRVIKSQQPYSLVYFYFSWLMLCLSIQIKCINTYINMESVKYKPVCYLRPVEKVTLSLSVRSCGERAGERQYRRHKGNKQLECNMIPREQVIHTRQHVPFWNININKKPGDINISPFISWMYLNIMHLKDSSSSSFHVLLLHYSCLPIK